jgi:hypothetical protein
MCKKIETEIEDNIYGVLWVVKGGCDALHAEIMFTVWPGVTRILSADIPQGKSTIGKKLWVSFLPNN